MHAFMSFVCLSPMIALDTISEDFTKYSPSLKAGMPRQRVCLDFEHGNLSCSLHRSYLLSLSTRHRPRCPVTPKPLMTRMLTLKLKYNLYLLKGPRCTIPRKHNVLTVLSSMILFNKSQHRALKHEDVHY